MDLFLFYLYAYLIGSVPTGYLLGLWIRKVDIRKYGSGNVGTSNVFIHIGKRWGILLGATEFLLKGASPVWIGLLILDLPVQESSGPFLADFLFGFHRDSFHLVGAALLALAGNNWSIFLKFKGGRGLAVAGGGLSTMALYECLICCVVSLLGYLFLKIPAGIITLVCLLLLPFWVIVFGQTTSVLCYCLGVNALVLIKRLLGSEELFPDSVSKPRLLLTRLIFDRDLMDRDAWVKKVPQSQR
jgi:glycerol-3-phosphate acyltransferase PlsY